MKVVKTQLRRIYLLDFVLEFLVTAKVEVVSAEEFSILGTACMSGLDGS